MRRLLIIIAFMLASMHTAQAGIFNAKVKILDNGLEVIVVENHRAPVVSQHLFYKVGGMDDPPGKSGIAHLLEHMMFKGTSLIPEGEFSATVSKLGGQDNAFTSPDVTAYYQQIPTRHIARVMEMEADRMRNLAFDTPNFSQSFLSERDVVIEERTQRTDNNPLARLREQVSPAFYQSHPYRNPIIGWLEELERLTLEDAKAFYDHYYHPNNALLIIVGDVKSEEIFKLAEKIYGKIPRKPTIIRPEYARAIPTVTAELTMVDPLIQVPSWQMLLPAPTYGWTAIEAIPDLIALEIGIEAIASGNSSPLYVRLAIEEKKMVSVGGYSFLQRRGPGQIGFYFTPADGVSMDEAEQAFHTALEESLETALTPQRIQIIKNRMIDRTEYITDSLTEPAQWIATMRLLGIPLDLLEQWTDGIEAIAPDHVKTVIKRYLNQSGRIISRGLPEAQATTN